MRSKPTTAARIVLGTAATCALFTGCQADVVSPTTSASRGRATSLEPAHAARGARRSALPPGGQVLAISGDEGTFRLDVTHRILETPNGGLVAIDQDELPALQAMFRDMAVIDPGAAEIDALVPPECPFPPESSIRGGCFVNEQGGPQPPGGTAFSAGLPRPAAAVPPVGALADAAAFRGVLPATPARDALLTATSPIDCLALFHEIRNVIPAYRESRRLYTWSLAFVGTKAVEEAARVGKAIGDMPFGELPKLSALRELVPVAGTWLRVGGSAIVTAGFTFAQALHTGQAGRLGFLVATFNAYQCGTRHNWREIIAHIPGAPGGGGGPPGSSGGAVLIICRYLDHYDSNGHYTGSETLGCQMQMT